MNAGLDSTAKRREFYQPMAKQNFCKAGLLHSENGLALLKYNLGYQLFHKYGTQEQMAATSFIDKMKSLVLSSPPSSNYTNSIQSELLVPTPPIELPFPSATPTNSITKNSFQQNMATGKVNIQAAARLRTVLHCKPDPLAAIVPATPLDRMCVVETGKP